MVPNMNLHLSTGDVLEALYASGKSLREWGRAIDGTPMLAARAGGDKQPAIFITAGAHSTETAGVHAALNLLQMLDTEHEVQVLPLRDPLGFAGVNRCLSFAAGRTIQVPDHRAILNYLTTHAQLTWREADMHLFQLGDFGFMWNEGLVYDESFRRMRACITSLAREDPEVLKPLRGKSLMLINPMVDSEGAEEMQRCWHSKISASGEWLHLNRFFGGDDVPPEVAAVKRLMQTVRPGLTCDLHEGHGKGFWMPIPEPAENPERVFKMTQAYFDYIHSCSYPITDYDDWYATAHKDREMNWMRPESRLPGFFWCAGENRDPRLRHD